jgi:hypothetical protein
MIWKTTRAISASLALGVATAALSISLAPAPAMAAAINTKNEALVKAINDAQAAAKAQNWAVALQKAKEADAIKDDKPTALNPIIHEMIVSYAINARDFPAAMAQLDKNIASGEGNKLQNLKQALGVAISAKNKEKTDQYAKELGTNLDSETRLFIASQMMNAGQLKESLEYAKPALEGNASEAALKFEQAVYFKMNDQNGRRAALEQLVTSYPKPEYWHDLLQLARNEKGLNDEQLMDIYRLRFAVGDLKTLDDYTDMAQEALVAGYPAEAKQVLDKAAAANLLKGDRSARLVKLVNDRVAADAAAQADLQKKAAADPNTGVKLGLMYWSFGKTKEAEDAIKAAVASGKLSSPDEAKVALGHVLLTQGKNQDAATTFSSVPKASKEANIARLWSIYARHPEPATAGAEKAAAPARRKG